MVRAWCLGIALVLAPCVVSAQTPLFSSGIDLVYVGLSVMDDDGKPVVDLTPADIEIREDGLVQEIRYFARGIRSGDVDGLGADPGGPRAGAAGDVPLHLGMLFDASESMGEDGRFAKTAAVRFLNTMTYAEDMTLVDFDEEVRVGRYGQVDFPRLVERIRGSRPSGMTAFYDALGVYLDGAFDQGGRKVLLVYTDGEDTRSRMSFSDTLDLLRASEVTMYAIGFEKRLRSSVRMRQRQRLSQLAELTGGRAFFPSEVSALDEIYEEIGAELDNRYSIGYVSTNQEPDGTWREIEVTLLDVRPDRRDLTLRAREGYYAPYLETPPAR